MLAILCALGALVQDGDRPVVESREFTLAFTCRSEKVVHKTLWVSRDGGRAWKPADEAGVEASWGDWAEGKIRCRVRVPEDGDYDFYPQLGDLLSNRAPEPQPGRPADPRLRFRVVSKPAPPVPVPTAAPAARPPVEPAPGARPDVARARALYDRARVLHAQGRWAEAELKYQEALAAWPEFAQVHNDLGKLYDDRKDPARALEHFLRARKLCAADPVPWVNAARAQVALGLHAEALADLRDAAAVGLEKDERAPVLAGELLWEIARAARQGGAAARAREACELLVGIRGAAPETRARAERMLAEMPKP
jgi:tetratricopeptide (TPR) repeat protein